MTNQAPKQALKVLQIASGDLWAGAEAQIYYLNSELLRHENIELHVVLLNDLELAKKLTKSGIRTYILDETKLSSITILYKLIQLTRKIRPDIIHTHRQKENVLGSIATQFVKQCKSIRTQHGDEEKPPKFYQVHKWIFKALDRFVGRHVQACIIAVSDELAKKLSTQYPANKIKTVHNGINLAEVLDKSEKFTPKLPGSIDSLKIGIFARLSPVKRIDIFLEVANKLSANMHEFCFYIFGDGPLGDTIKQQIADKKLSSNVFLLGHHNNAYPYMKAMDYVLITSDHEGLPMNLLEAMCLHVPVLAHAVGGIPHALDNGSAGYLVSDNQPEVYATRLREIKKSNSNMITDKAYQRVEKCFSSSRNAEEIIKLYYSLV